MMIGIDLGTTNSSCALYESGEPFIIPNDRGNRVTPSIVSRTASGDILVGETAKNQAVINAERTIRSVKRLMGTGSSIVLGDASYSPEQISSFILKKIKKDAESYLGRPIEEAVITVPAYFSDIQRRSTMKAGEMAGFSVRRIINEPTSAGLSCSVHLPEICSVLVFDLGGGTFDVSVLRKKGTLIEVLATAGDNHFGGIDFDGIILEKVLGSFSAQADMDISHDPVILQQLTDLVEKAKIELSSRNETQIALPFFRSGDRSLHLLYSMSRREFNGMIAPMTDKACSLTLEAVSDAGIQPGGVDFIVFSGGSSRVPVIRDSILKLIPAKVASKVHPEEVVACGAAVQAHMLTDKEESRTLRDITPLPLGVKAAQDSFFSIIGKNTTIPTKRTQVFTTLADGQQAVEIDILQGLSKKASMNSSLGKFQLFGIQSASGGVPRIEVVFSIDEDGILSVKARDIKTGAYQDISLTEGDGRKNGTSRKDSSEKLSSLAEKTKKLFKEYRGILDAAFAREIQEIFASYKKGETSGQTRDPREYRLAFETIICEIESIAKERERKDA